MSQILRLKDRFEKLQKTLDNTSGEEAYSAPAPEKSQTIELKASTRPDLHESLRNTDAQSYDWKKTFKESYIRPTIESSRDPRTHELEWKIQGLVEKETFISLTQSDAFNLQIKNLLHHMDSRKRFWKMMLTDVE